MKRPASLRIVGKRVRVEYKPDFPDYGESFFVEQRITIRDGLPLNNEQDTLLHEAIHFLEDAANLELSEKQVTVLATMLLGFFHDNPSFARYLLRREKGDPNAR